MINVLKKLLFGRESSSLNLFLAMPVLAFVSVCCLCPGSRDEPQTCITPDGANLVWAGKNLLDIRLADGTLTPIEPTRGARVIVGRCGVFARLPRIFGRRGRATSTRYKEYDTDERSDSNLRDGQD